MKTFKKGGIHPPEDKATAGMAIEAGPRVAQLSIVLSQSIGAPSRPIVKAGERVMAGQPIAEPGGVVSAWLHSPCAGTVKKIEALRNPQGYPATAIVIERDPECTDAFTYPPLDPATATPEQIKARIRECGIVGLGGATFPTDVKLNPPAGMTAECVILNGAECEPRLTCDDRLMREQASDIALGGYCLMRAAGVSRCYIGIEQNKPEAIEAMREAASRYSGMEVCVLRTKYPQGGEKQLIAAITGREVPSGALPVSVGAIVDNVATAWAVARAVSEGRALTGRVVTVCGPGALNPGNYYVELGTPLSALFPADESATKIIAGGPMMGRAVSTLDTPSTKGLSGILVYDKAPEAPLLPCIRCGACYDACPMGLEPMLLARQSEAGEWEEALASSVLDCIECGSCAYTCPAGRPLLDRIRYAKSRVRGLKK